MVSTDRTQPSTASRWPVTMRDRRPGAGRGLSSLAVALLVLVVVGGVGCRAPDQRSTDDGQASPVWPRLAVYIYDARHQTTKLGLVTGAQLETIPGLDGVTGTAWAPGGNSVLATTRHAVYLVRAPARGPVSVPEVVTVPGVAGVSSSPQAIGSIACAPCGDLAAIEAGGRIYVLHWANGKPVAVDCGRGRLPVWSPDGSRVAFATSEAGKSGVCVYDIERHQRDTIAATPDAVGSISWSSDCRRLAYVRCRWVLPPITAMPTSVPDSLRVVDVVSRADASVVGSLPGVVEAAWRPGAEQICIVGSTGLSLVNSGGNGLARLQTRGYTAMSPAWSADGQWLAVTAFASGRATAQIVVRRISDDREWAVTNPSLDCQVPKFEVP